MRWKCSIPGREGTDWQGGFFPLTMEFSEDYPAKPPKVPAWCLGLLSVFRSDLHTNNIILVSPCCPRLKVPP